ncbi:MULTISPECIES: universal stress protein [Corynebacterium]|jgi:universal stress protein|uniref:universal stress protein n=1 Tax=Corynebacterium TaxID=1716 RepID=UPI001EF6AF7B|nr:MULTISPECIES: universal stress protein [Corynebacterium]MCG7243577.1 universal stress protein [Corynebacterium sp. ACRPS]MCG7271737.1 universal stress protein [Corynebacterium sp. ACRQM]MCG7233794.1 universal stress protein [Corynebacterium sp. ACRPR]MDK8474852.1 universal stress protein [Corynebacterium sp. MSK078]MDK8660119.1 universal stress protein [Corynebacterium sp. MSK204]
MGKKSNQPLLPTLHKGSAKEPLRILISWSPSSSGTEPLDFAAWLSRTAVIEVRVISTVFQPWTTTSLSKLGGKYKKWFKEQKQACTTATAAALTEAGIPEKYWDDTPSVLVDGPSRPQLLTEMAQDFQADLILLGPNQAAPKGRFFPSSTADTLLHYSPQSLGLIPRKAKLSKHGVTRFNFVITERGDRADRELLGAAALADRWDLPLRILAFSANDLLNSPSKDKSDIALKLTAEWHEDSLAMLDRARDRIQDAYPELEVSSEIGSGAGWSGAVDSLKWKKGDLMLMASTPQGPIARVFLGSNATELLPHIRVPVLIHPATD